MAIERKELKDVATTTRSAFQKAMGEVQKGNSDYALELLKGIVQRNPGFVDARAALREAEKIRSNKMGGLGKFFAGLKSSKFIVRAKANAAKNPVGALAELEEALALYLYAPTVLNTLADVAKNGGANFIAIEALEIINELDPKNEANLNKLCELYEKEKDGNNVLIIRQKLAGLHPDNLELQAKVREAAALATMSTTAWGKEQSSGKADDDSKKASTTQGDKIVRAEEDILQEIRSCEELIASGAPEGESVDMRRKLAEFYFRLERYEDAIDTYEWIVNKMGTLDPAIDKAIERCNVAIGKQNIAQLEANGATQEEIDAQKQAIFDYRMERYTDRVQKYSNDLMLRYELAELYWEGGMVDEALEQFQLAQKQPKMRLFAIVYLGRCFSEKGQYDMAVEQFNKALADMLVMDVNKLDTLYYLGLTYERMGKKAEALDCFKQIYSANVNYRDVSTRMNAFYEKQKAAKAAAESAAN